MGKLDLKKAMKALYSPSVKEVPVVNVPEMQFVVVNGFGDPNTSPAFQTAIEAIFSVSYTLKFMVKKREGGVDYTVMPREGLWWAEDSRSSVSGRRTVGRGRS